ncbi:hypothetical protein [Flavobacterium sp.]|uniref:hypothetical protein n=1 Tax=Flavobacterium sp. TaxID=239 RepID=UPI00286C2B8D|nr:hypothetical protein [Flavobacterium sp.]
MNLELLERIAKSSAHTQNRVENATHILQNTSLLPELISFSFSIENKSHIRACCILEKVFEIQMDLSFKYLDFICENLSELKNDSAIRSVSRFIHFLVLDSVVKKNLSEKNLENITTACFDWLISDLRVAPKAHAIYTLFELGKNQDWIYPELKQLLEYYTGSESAGYKSVARRILKKLN